jgi:hypothetical protein
MARHEHHSMNRLRRTRKRAFPSKQDKIDRPTERADFAPKTYVHGSVIAQRDPSAGPTERNIPDANIDRSESYRPSAIKGDRCTCWLADDFDAMGATRQQ